MKSLTDFLCESRTKAGLEAEKKGLIHTGKGYYADAKGNIVAKSEGGTRLVPLSPEEKQRLTSGQPLTTPAPSPVPGQMPAGGQQTPSQQVQQEPVKQEPKQDKKDDGEEEPMVPRNEGGGSVVITFGRFNPPHIGHQKLLDRVADEAYKDGSDYMIYPSQSHDPKKNPLDFDSKTNVMQTIFPQHAGNIVSDPSGGRNIFDVLKGLHAQGYDNVKIVVGDDRVKEFTNITGKYNGKTYNFGKLDIVSAGERDPDSDDVEGMSASKMRKAAQENDYDSFKKGLPSDVSAENAKAIYMQLRRSMNLEEELYHIAPKLDSMSLREEYFMKNIFNVGDIVESLTTGVIGKIIVRGSNYVIMIDEEGRSFRTWLENITEI